MRGRKREDPGNEVWNEEEVMYVTSRVPFLFFNGRTQMFRPCPEARAAFDILTGLEAKNQNGARTW